MAATTPSGSRSTRVSLSLARRISGSRARPISSKYSSRPPVQPPAALEQERAPLGEGQVAPGLLRAARGGDGRGELRAARDLDLGDRHARGGVDVGKGGHVLVISWRWRGREVYLQHPTAGD